MIQVYMDSCWLTTVVSMACLRYIMPHEVETLASQELVLSPEEYFNQSIEHGIRRALATTEADFEKNSHPEHNLAYHNTEHVKSVIERVELILQNIQRATKTVEPNLVTERDIQIGRLVAAFHDRKQDWEESVLKNQIIRKRATAANEQASAQELIAYMDEVNTNSQVGNIFGEDDKKLVEEAILATIPGFDRQRWTVVQPNVRPNSSIVAKAMALADLGTAGMEGGEAFIKDGDNLFREDNLDIGRALRKPDLLDESTKESFRQRMINWSKLQITFAEGRQALFDHELVGLRPEAQKILKQAVFTRFEESIESAKIKAGQREDLSFDELARDMGYE